MRTIIVGSTAFDRIMTFKGNFGEHILPDKTNSINVAFHISQLVTEHGGTGANISYALSKLGDTPILVSSVGKLDSSAYLTKLYDCDIDISNVCNIDDMYCAQANILTDISNNQITGFHPGAMSYSKYIDFEQIVLKYHAPNQYPDISDIVIIAPDDKDTMLNSCFIFSRFGKKCIFDPGQVLPMFSASELSSVFKHAYAITVNDYEASLLTSITGKSIEAITKSLSFNGDGGLIITRGKNGVDLYKHGCDPLHVDVVNVPEVIDPTGCGDAFRAGLLYVMARTHNWKLALQVGACLGGVQIQYKGAQNHNITLQQVLALGTQSYGTIFNDELLALSNHSSFSFSN